VLFVAHAGKSKQQRGTSKKEDVMDVVIKLDHSQDYQQEMGAASTVEFEKARHLSGDDARNFEASLARDQQDTAPARAIQAQAGRIGSAHSTATLAYSINEIIGSLTRATLCRNLKRHFRQSRRASGWTWRDCGALAQSCNITSVFRCNVFIPIKADQSESRQTLANRRV
jgi:hypothetical protein